MVAVTSASLSTDSTADDIQDHLARVEALLRIRFAEIGRDWAAIAAPDPGEDDAGAVAQPVSGNALASSIDLPRSLTRSTLLGGKRLRPTFSLLGFLAVGGTVGSARHTDVITVSAALELLHSFALIHDDVMDQSRSRRGRPTVHIGFTQQHAARCAAGESVRFGENLAILLGDLAHAEADRLIAGCPAEIRTHWYDMITELIRGQFDDLVGAADRTKDPVVALTVARLKSGGYTVRRPLELGALAAGAEPAMLRQLSAYGREIGAAFALRDDLLGVWGDPAVTGKPAGDDLLAGKPTIIIALAQQRLPRSQQRLLDRVGDPDLDRTDIAALQGLIRESGVEAEVEKMITRHVEQGIGYLQGIGSSRQPASGGDDVLGTLHRLAGQIAWRDR